MKIHILKIEEKYWWRVNDGSKSCESRRNDRDFQTNDFIQFDVLWEGTDICSEAVKQSKRALFIITHIIPGGIHGIESGFCVLSIRPATTEEIHFFENK